jgi:hypothetical protein
LAIGLGVIAVVALVSYFARSETPGEPTPRLEGAEATHGSSRVGAPLEARDRDVREDGDPSHARIAARGGTSHADTEPAVVGDGGTRTSVARTSSPSAAPSSTPSGESSSASSATSSAGAQGRPLEIEMPPERRLAIGEAIDGMAAMRLQELRSELAEARASGNRARAQRIERWIADLEAEAPNRNAALDRLHEQVPPERAAE